MSSRNTYLSPEERKAALILHKSLQIGEEMMRAGERDALKIKTAIQANMETEVLARVDYVEIVDADSLEQVTIIEKPVLTATAVYIGNTRLIDNFTYEP